MNLVAADVRRLISTAGSQSLVTSAATILKDVVKSAQDAAVLVLVY